MMIALLVFAVAANADIITFNFTGVVNSSSGTLAAGIGSAMSGSFSYDDGLTSWFGVPGARKYRNEDVVANQALTGGWDASVTTAGGTANTSGNLKPAAINHALMSQTDKPGVDRIVFRMFRKSPSDDEANFDFRDYQSPHADGVKPGSHGLTLNPITSLGGPWTDPNDTLSTYRDFDSNGNSVGNVTFHLSTLTNAIPTPVPEPGTYAMFGLALAGYAIYRRRHAA